MLRLGVVVLSVIDVLFQGLGPGDVVNLRDVVSVQLESTQELVEAETRVSSDLGDADGSAGRLECGSDDHTGNVVHRNHVDGVVNVGAGRQLDASLDHTDEEVIGVGS